jgi:tetraacyldisaccharide 4'-kinase
MPEPSMPARSVVDRIWAGTDPLALLARAALAPAEAGYAGLIAARSALYRAGMLRSVTPALPAISIGNLTVGGTGKTPVAAFVAAELASRGGRPAIVLRGYGGDEPLVHERLNPGIPVIVSADRVAAIAEAGSRGADVAVLDDAFQHRRVRRVADVVLVSAEGWSERRRLIPAGPWREPLSSARRASLLVITRKAATRARSEAVAEAVTRAVPGVPVALAYLAPRSLRRVDEGETMPLTDLAGRRVSVIAAIANPAALLAQLGAVGARLRGSIFADHHAFSADDAERLAASLATGELPVCTLKDAVKLGPLWPRAAPPLWYVSQHVAVERGRESLDALLVGVLHARSTSP